MRVVTLIRRLPWLVSLLAGCGDDTAGGVGAESSSGDTESDAAVTAVDDVIFTAQNVSVALDAASGLLGNDAAPDGGPLTVTDFDAVSAAGGNVVIGDDGAVTYDPVARFWGPDSFEYTIEDDTDATATVTVYVAPVRIPLADVAAGMGGFVLDGEANGDNSGVSVSGAGDVNSDGMDDIIVGAFLADPNGDDSGRSYVVFGVPTGHN